MAKPANGALAPNPGGFAIDRDRLDAAMRRNDNDGIGTRDGLEFFANHGLAAQICGALRFAEQIRAVSGPAGVQLTTCEHGDTIVLALGEDRSTGPRMQAIRSAAGLPLRRQVSAAIDAIDFTGANPDLRSIKVAVAALDALAVYANGLLATLRLLQDAEAELAERIARPITKLTIAVNSRTDVTRVSVSDLVAEDPKRAGGVWVLLIAALESGEALADYDGSTQRNYIVDQRARPHLARQLLDAKPTLIAEGNVSGDELYPPDGGFDAYLDPKEAP